MDFLQFSQKKQKHQSTRPPSNVNLQFSYAKNKKYKDLSNYGGGGPGGEGPARARGRGHAATAGAGGHRAGRGCRDVRHLGIQRGNGFGAPGGQAHVTRWGCLMGKSRHTPNQKKQLDDAGAFAHINITRKIQPGHCRCITGRFRGS